MINIRNLIYKTMVFLESGVQLDISGAVHDLSWEENEGELAARITFTCQNADYAGKSLSQTIKPGCQIIILTNCGNDYEEIVRGRVEDWEPSQSTSEDNFGVIAYDDLFSFEKSSDDYLVNAGTGTKSALITLFNKWKVPVGEYKGPDIVHAQKPYINQSLGNIVGDILDIAHKQGAPHCFLRSAKGKISVLPFGGNTEIYHFDADTNLTTVKDKISTQNLVTRVKITAKNDDDAIAPVEAVMDGHTEFGIRQRIYIRPEDTDLDAAKTEAQTILSDEGEPERNITLSGPDVPFVRKGDRVHVDTERLSGYFYVKSIRHNTAEKTMNMSVVPVDKNEISTSENTEYQRGENVIVNGRVHLDSYGTGAGKTLKNHHGIITIKVKTSRPCPYHIDNLGWVYPTSVSKT